MQSREIPGRVLVQRTGEIRPLTTIRPIGQKNLVNGLIYLLSFVESVDLIEEKDRFSGW